MTRAEKCGDEQFDESEHLKIDKRSIRSTFRAIHMKRIEFLGEREKCLRYELTAVNHEQSKEMCQLDRISSERELKMRLKGQL